MRQFYKNLSIWLIIALVALFAFNALKQQPEVFHQVPYNVFLKKAETGFLPEVTLTDNVVTWATPDGSKYRSVLPPDHQLIRKLISSNVTLNVEKVDQPPWYLVSILNWLPFVLLFFIWLLFIRKKSDQPGGKAMAFGKSRAKLVDPEHSKVTLDDVAGIEEAKEEVREIVAFLRNPDTFTQAGARIPSGVLLYGEPGTGKTLLAKAIAGEAGVPFFSISGSNFVEMYVGIGASRVRDLFREGKKKAPCILFIDEIDAVGRHRSSGGGAGGNDEREQTLNQLLVEMDGFEANDHVIVVAATNRQDILDPALLRPGRFDRQVMVPLPDVGGREKILQVHAQRTMVAEDVHWQTIAKGTPGFSGAQLANMINEAALLMTRRQAPAIDMEILEAAKDKVLMGAERRSLIITDREKKVTAYHEAGHALVAWMLPGADPVHKVTIIPRGRALGVTMQLPDEERNSQDRTYLTSTLCTLLGGRVAEEIVFNEITTGAGNDIERVSDIARKMVCEWGMSEVAGPLTFRGADPLNGQPGPIISEDTAVMIDREVKNLVQSAYSRARSILLEHRDLLDTISTALLEQETISRQDILTLVEQHSGTHHD
ncbi:ATP-dependent zinc metalloprotease FtsH [Desulfogranum mediterraneum]|uniref:ATP-dependent zinc metalloprotease FtsH n=1 Tax=Desulfogranum mediterraneum TaxID=160661 RepID=UPI0004009CC8|nr:ATP-dependent zinc metalloprotease FtsH [Desulfogranum mediterraneum]